MTKTATIAILAAALAVSACAKKAPKDLPIGPEGSVTTDDGTGGTAAGVILPGSQADFVQQLLGQDTIYFDTDRFNVDSADQQALEAQAAWLQRYPAKRITIEGHCDERGTREYNLALGERRANAAKNYLVSVGVDASRITTVSYGKERPIAVGSDEDSWAKNRRAVTVTVD